MNRAYFVGAAAFLPRKGPGAFALLVMFFALAASAGQLTGRVVRIADGDTLTILDAENRQIVIRLAGIDAPEKAQDFGNRSKQSLGELTFQKMVNVEYAKRDRYGRMVGKILVGSRDVNLEQVRRGLAWHYKDYAMEQAPADRDLYGTAEVIARDRRIGIWSNPHPVAPWQHRRQKADARAARRPETQ